MALALLFELSVQRGDILTVGAPVDSLLIGFTRKEHDTFGFLSDQVVEDLLGLGNGYFDHCGSGCRYFI